MINTVFFLTLTFLILIFLFSPYIAVKHIHTHTYTKKENLFLWFLPKICLQTNSIATLFTLTKKKTAISSDWQKRDCFRP